MSAWWRLRGRALICLLLCFIAVTAMAIDAFVVVSRLRGTRSPSAAEVVAPGLAALSDKQLAELLPGPGDFPSSWRTEAKTYYDRFGYQRRRTPGFNLDRPAECADLNEYAAGENPGAEISGYVPAAPTDPGYGRDVRLSLGREFDQDGFGTVISLARRCSRYTIGGTTVRTVQIVEDSRPANGAQRFRISLNDWTLGRVVYTRYVSFARVDRLILTGTATDHNRDTLDNLFDATLRRMSVA
jgi:hypothetical protein